MANNNACSTLTDGVYGDACKLLRGGFRDLYVANYGQIDAITLTADEVDDVTMKVEPVSGNPFNWFSMRVKKNTGGLQNPGQIGTNNRSVNQVITFTLEGFSTALKLRYDEMLVADLVFIAVRHDNTAHMVGRLSGAQMTTGDLGVGVAIDDLVGAPLEFTADGELESMRTVAVGTAITVLNEDGVTVSTVTF
ncbi:MAG: hypothetical protein CMJ25_15080 [Phycisphaerae bacterium]|nr:hypothetical protein [Phycisphaerae bacterium]|tara:strand:- start:3665 stop:4243 length:579 start_codon:yes stop_codon:yes gene_type:complete